MDNFNITLFEACELLNRSKKSISRYIRRGLLHPERVKSQQGTLEYRFSKADLEAFKAQEVLKAEQTEQIRPDRTERTDQTGHLEGSFIKNKVENDQIRQDTTDQTGHDKEVLTALKAKEEIIILLKSELYKKDEELKTKNWQVGSLYKKIDNFLERQRENNIILKSLQDKVFLLEQPKKDPIYSDAEETGHDPEETGQGKTDGIPENRVETDDYKPPVKQEKTGFWKKVFNSKQD